MHSQACALREDRGAATTQLVILFPLLILTSLVAVQLALAWHAQHIAQFIAQDALAAARPQHASAADGRAQARHRMGTLAGRILTSPHVDVTRSPTRVSAHVTGGVLQAVPLLELRASGAAAGATERLTTPEDGQQ
ncbi:TadE/TadG family type IV pilus assembly protein [Streptomyces sp. AA1529]|uniref:TadE/TadG family type IV pilus assembly protein n=1 Tax=Streptomyces sp. AA1529 TaxID=1203257 RepID=UPI000306ADE1|nr:TadE/TadG family type IV pilus assembly protein [Streptomyces sp. AA1529]